MSMIGRKRVCLEINFFCSSCKSSKVRVNEDQLVGKNMSSRPLAYPRGHASDKKGYDVRLLQIRKADVGGESVAGKCRLIIQHCRTRRRCCRNDRNKICECKRECLLACIRLESIIS